MILCPAASMISRVVACCLTQPAGHPVAGPQWINTPRGLLEHLCVYFCGRAARFSRLGLAESFRGRASATANAASDSACSRVLAVSDRSLPYQLARVEAELLGAVIFRCFDGFQLFVRRLPQEVCCESAFPACPHGQQRNPKIGIEISAGTIFDENAPAALQEFAARWSDPMIRSAPGTWLPLAKEPASNNLCGTGIVAPGESPADFWNS